MRFKKAIVEVEPVIDMECKYKGIVTFLDNDDCLLYKNNFLYPDYKYQEAFSIINDKFIRSIVRNAESYHFLDCICGKVTEIFSGIIGARKFMVELRPRIWV